ncbi:MAG: SMP-30/gluconolactonase/LRE family protein, partial [Anaerolineae bacterium]|nr:SMP-30/gluconolactonase/LRE family protein [Anaerolineae bacterium]
VYAHEPTMNQPNDIAVGANDIVYASDPNWAAGTGQIWRVEPNGSMTKLESDMGTTNGIEVSPDETTLYVNETVQRRIWTYDLSPDGEISHKRLLIEFPDFGLDGQRCDIAGNLYVARYGKGTVAKISPKGEVLVEVELAGNNCTNVAFGGADGRTCYVTVADRGNIECFRTDLPGRSWMLFQRR